MQPLNLQFRPESYWDHPDPVTAIVSDIKGQNRREMARDFLSGRSHPALGEIEEGLLEETLDAETRSSLGATHPSWMGGEYLPNCLPGEVEIARIVLASVTQDVFSIRARRRRGGRRILYRIVDEYPESGRPAWGCRPASSARPLTTGQLIGLIDGAKHPDFEPSDRSLVEKLLDLQEGADPKDLYRFVEVESGLYPGIGEYYRRITEEWVRRELGELEDDEEDGADDD